MHHLRQITVWGGQAVSCCYRLLSLYGLLFIVFWSPASIRSRVRLDTIVLVLNRVRYAIASFCSEIPFLLSGLALSCEPRGSSFSLHWDKKTSCLLIPPSLYLSLVLLFLYFQNLGDHALLWFSNEIIILSRSFLTHSPSRLHRN
jgi:hypothetical protein